jgi:predicted NBD/HSP70 family sugar kinase
VVPEGSIDDAAIALRVNQLARRGDAASQQAYAVLSEYLSEAITNLFNLLDPQIVLLSGGLIEDYPQFVADVERKVQERLHFGVRCQPRVRMACGGRYAGVPC